jgi:lincosamide nucleotidyltransferase A/C/D/E
MEVAEVLRVLSALARAGILPGLTGGWGIDALLGRQTRPHGDADVGLPAECIDAAIECLTEIGYHLTLDERPARLVLACRRGTVDLHPIVWGPTGAGVQTGLDGETFEYPPGSLDAEGVIAGAAVRCGNVSLQLAFHERYLPRDRDRADMTALAEAFGLVLPQGYLDSSDGPPQDERAGGTG